MPEGEGTIQIPEAMRQFLTEHGFTVDEKGMADAFKAFGNYKTDITKLKSEAKGKSALEQELEQLRAAEEQRRQATLTETEKVKEEKAKLEKALLEKDQLILKAQKDMLLKETMFDALKDKPLTSVRKQLYQAAASSQEWDGAEALQSIFAKVDTDLETEFKALKVTLPAPGDGAGAGGGTGGGATKYDDAYFERLQKKSVGLPQ